MRAYPKKQYTKDQEELLVRFMERHEVDGVYAFFREMPEKDRMHLMFDVTRRESVVRFVEQADGTAIVRVVAEQGGELVAIGSLYRDRFGWERHVGKIRVSVRNSHQSRGIGTLMARELLYTALNLGLEKLRASIMVGEHKAEHILLKLGFHGECVLPGCIRTAGGREADQLIMGLLL